MLVRQRERRAVREDARHRGERDVTIPDRFAVERDARHSPIERAREAESLGDVVTPGAIRLLEVLRRQQQSLAPNDGSLVAHVIPRIVSCQRATTMLSEPASRRSFFVLGSGISTYQPSSLAQKKFPTTITAVAPEGRSIGVTTPDSPGATARSRGGASSLGPNTSASLPQTCFRPRPLMGLESLTISTRQLSG